MATPGTSFRELINFTTGKQNATREDLESSLAAKGYRSSDIRKIGKAYERVSGSGNEYVLHPEKGFNVFDSAGSQKEGSGKKKGNKAGADLGDLIGLGNDVSLLAGALRNELPGYTQSKQPKVTVSPESSAQSSSDTSEKSSAIGISSFTKSKTKAKSKTSGTTEVDVDGMKKAYPEQRKPAPTIGASAAGKASGSGKKGEAFEDEGFDWQRALLGDAPLAWDVENYKDLGAAFNPAQFWSENARQFARDRGQKKNEKIHHQFDMANPGGDFTKRVIGGLPETGLLSPLLVKGIPGARLLGPASQESLNAAKEASHVANAASVEENFLNNLTEDLNHLHRRGGKMYARGGAIGDRTFDTSPYETSPDLGPDFFDTRSPEGYAPATQEELVPGAEYAERDPQKGARERGGLDYGSLLSGLVKYGAPAAYLGAEHNQIQKLRGMINPQLQAPELMTGSVQDLPRPDFSLPYQPGLDGSSLTEAQNSGLAREKFTREQRNNFELRNALNRQDQKNAIIDRTNQAAIQKAGIGNQERMIKSSNAFNEFAFLLGDRGTTAGSLFQNLDQGIYGAQVSHDARQLSHAQEVIRNPEKYPNDQQWARRVLSGYKRKGGKLSRPTRYSKPC